MKFDIIELSIKKITGKGEAVGNLYVHRELDGSDTDMTVTINFDYQPKEKPDLEYPGCDEEVWITEVSANHTHYEIECIENLTQAESSILKMMAKEAYESELEAHLENQNKLGE